MPELPDVEGFRRVLAGVPARQRIDRVEVRDAGVLHGVTPAQLSRTLAGRSFAEPRRHGKWLIAPLAGDGTELLIHFGMTGSLSRNGPDEPAHPHDRVVIVLGDSELRYRDMRKLKGVWLARDGPQARRIMGTLGPDALDVTARELDGLLAGRRAKLKALLTDQSVIAGLGNLLADEICWRARVSPERAAGDLDAAERRRLHTAMRKVLGKSVEAGHVPGRRGWLTGARDARGGRCPRCGTTLSRRRVSGRMTVWCPRCQPAG